MKPSLPLQNPLGAKPCTYRPGGPTAVTSAEELELVTPSNPYSFTTNTDL